MNPRMYDASQNCWSVIFAQTISASVNSSRSKRFGRNFSSAVELVEGEQRGIEHPIRFCQTSVREHNLSENLTSNIELQRFPSIETPVWDNRMISRRTEQHYAFFGQTSADTKSKNMKAEEMMVYFLSLAAKNCSDPHSRIFDKNHVFSLNF